ncbi:pyruvyl transferase [Altererythrobacter atlanticus]|uniref:polysaccharide pyruvyl transferase family protein n=1 Tax=Croceibacterium atlanticum TaxID=1267766 RepID=UPI0016059CBE|nr:polysaccharide pyruvyl transferase family protein [Croceibacterium atlanticum]MBB5733947.1 pyruvyl transferase [Croceibacterium atlanticum]
MQRDSMTMFGRIREKLHRAPLRARRPVLEESYPHVEIFFWKPAQGLNFGDYLASAVTQRMLAAREILFDEPAPKARLFTIGSVLHFAATGDTVWGSGRNGKISSEQHPFADLDVRAVRGPLTQKFLMDRGISVPSVFGDPALLIPRLFPQRFKRRTQPGKIGVVPNLHDRDLLDRDDVIDPMWNWGRVIDAICECEFIVSSSLHGLIIADAFGIPCSHVRLSETEPDFKYIDYCEGVGRSTFRSATSVEEALDAGPLSPPNFDAAPLLESFPYDLWEPKGAR